MGACGALGLESIGELALIQRCAMAPTLPLIVSAASVSALHSSSHFHVSNISTTHLESGKNLRALQYHLAKQVEAASVREIAGDHAQDQFSL